ncbi:hypothetical protein [Cohnella caldifontis]|uniref:hypothetical protein n=1 Tax=Cohnella caldifontis TaxID=3027471 RepID=UPI0023EDE7A5|nr:hypothetical protein [Cohnella sp. YIM B05605]
MNEKCNWSHLGFHIFLSRYLKEQFWFWIIHTLFFLLFGIALVIGAIFINKFKRTKNKKNNKLMQVVGIFSGVALIIFFINEFLPSYMDIPAYISKDYEIIRGKPDYISGKSRRDLYQTIEIKNIRLKNEYIIPLDSISEYEIYYLPNSKFVIKLSEIKQAK